MLRAAMNDSGKATNEASSVPTKAMTMVCSSLVQTSPCCQSGIVEISSKASDRFDCAGSMRSAADQMIAITSLDGLAPEWRVGVEEEIRPAEEAPPDDDLVVVDLGAAGEAEGDIDGRARPALFDQPASGCAA